MMAKKKTKAKKAAHMTQVKLIFWSGVRRQRILLHADLMIVDRGDGFPTTMVQVIESRAKNVTAMVHRGAGSTGTLK